MGTLKRQILSFFYTKEHVNELDSVLKKQQLSTILKK